MKYILTFAASSWCFHLLVYDARNHETEMKKILKLQGPGDEFLNMKKKTKHLFETSVTIHTTTQRYLLLHRCPHFKPRWLTVVCYCYLKTIIVIISTMTLHLTQVMIKMRLKR